MLAELTEPDENGSLLPVLESMTKSGLWAFEVKFDGNRCICRTFADGTYQLTSRSGKDMTDKYPELKISTTFPAILDGEILCYDENGKSDFSMVQHRSSRDRGIAQAAKAYPASFAVFDMLEMATPTQTNDLTKFPWSSRRPLLERNLNWTENVHVAKYTEDGVALFQEIEAKGMEGVIGKRKDSLYVQGNRGLWIKAKCSKTETFGVVGYTPGTGWRKDAGYFGALVLVKLPMDDKLVYVGSVGSGFDMADLKVLNPIVTKAPTMPCPFTPNPERDAIYCCPNLTVTVRFADYTADGRLRFPAFKGVANG
jgi:bifunctional non-homologous end joining protein LigD